MTLRLAILVVQVIVAACLLYYYALLVAGGRPRRSENRSEPLTAPAYVLVMTGTPGPHDQGDQSNKSAAEIGDGRDSEGDEVANGTYLYVLRGQVDGDSHGFRQTGQLVIMR